MNSLLSGALLRPFALWFLLGLSSAAVAADEPLRWVTVSGTAALARGDLGYLLTSASTTVVSLPASPPVGAIVRITGVGAGNWSAVGNKGQSIQANVAGSLESALLTSSGEIFSLASSFDGSRVIASVGGQGGGLFVSTDGGATWPSNNPSGGGFAPPMYVASSYDGSLLFADYGWVIESTNGGSTWTLGGGVIVLGGPVACSADGTKIAHVYGGPEVVSAGPIPEWIEAPGGNSPSAVWTCLASSSSGANLIASAGNSERMGIVSSTGTTVLEPTVTGGQIYTTANYGATWTAHLSAQNWTSVGTSADGSKLIAAGAGTQIYTSSDSGTTWTAQGSIANWTSVSSSADGTLLAAAAGGEVYTSVNSGATWTSGGIAGTVVCCSPDGSKLIVGNGNQISVQPFPEASGKPATTFSAVLGTQLSSAELIFVGRGRWQLLSHEGSLSFQ